MSRKQLTAKQLAFLEYIADHVRRKKVWPTYRELVDEFGYKSPNSVTQNLQALERKGYLARDDHGYRLVGKRLAMPVGFPVYGRISGGAFETSLTMEEVTLKDLFPGLVDVQAIRLEQPVRGLDVEAGDYLLVDAPPADGEMAIAMVDGEPAVCRIVGTDGTRRVQFPDGSAVSVSGGQEVQVLGRYAGHINRSGLYRSPSELASAELEAAVMESA